MQDEPIFANFSFLTFFGGLHTIMQTYLMSILPKKLIFLAILATLAILTHQALTIFINQALISLMGINS
jgi:hypothetical protein